MIKIINIVLTASVLLSIGGLSLNADASKGQRLYLKKLKYICGMNGAEMAVRHSTAQWEKLQKANNIADEIKTICPKVKDSAIKDKFMIHYYDFFKMYSNDSGNIPSC